MGINRIGSSGRKPLFSDMEAELLRFFKTHRDKGIPVTNYTLLREARRIAEAKQRDFTGSTAWLDGFKRRHQICYRRTTHVAQKPKPSAVAELQAF